MLKNYSDKQKAILYTIAWFLLNLFFSLTTVLADDEAYYWVYAKYLDWGYFDHPPMIALMIKVGTWLFNNELSIRFFTVVASSFTLWLLFQLTEFKRSAQLFLLFLTVPAFHALGFISAPDVPMLLFGTWYLYRFKKYLEEDSFKNIVYLALIVALLMYSKYHGLLLVIFTLLPNYKVLARKSFYSVLILSLLFFFPHIWWQIQNDLVSLRFHLFDRVRGAYDITFTSDYILGQLLFCGPLLFFLFAAKANKFKSDFSSTLKFTAIGFYIFFLLMSFRSYIEANWAAMGYVAALLIVHDALKESLNSFTKYTAIILSSILIAFRVFLILPFDKTAFEVTEQFGRDRAYYENFHQRAGDHPVLFCNNYQKASKYMFYIDKPAFTLNSYWYRRNQFDTWPIQKECQGKAVMCFAIQEFPNCTLENFNNDKIHYELNSSLKSYGYLSFELEQKEIHVKQGDLYKGELKVLNPYLKELKYDSTEIEIYAVLKDKDGHHLSPMRVAVAKEFQLAKLEPISFEMPVNIAEGEYIIEFGIYSKYCNVLWNSPLYKVFVKK